MASGKRETVGTADAESGVRRLLRRLLVVHAERAQKRMADISRWLNRSRVAMAARGHDHHRISRPVVRRQHVCDNGVVLHRFLSCVREKTCSLRTKVAGLSRLVSAIGSDPIFRTTYAVLRAAPPVRDSNPPKSKTCSLVGLDTDFVGAYSSLMSCGVPFVPAPNVSFHVAASVHILASRY